MSGPTGIYHGYQRRWIDDEARFKLGLMSRQIGKTFTTTGEIVENVLAAELSGKRTRWVILSRGERQAKEAMDDGVKLHLRAMGAAFDYFEADFRVDDDTSYKQLDVVFPGGSKITALPANPDTARGYSANVYLDEFAFHKDSRAIWKALFPVVSKPGLRLRITSTPNGRKNKFYELATATDKVWSRHSIDIYQAVADGLDRDIDELRAGMADGESWASEYELSFADDAGSWLGFDLITAAEDDNAGKPELYQGGPVFVGVDIAARHDLWVCIIFELIGDVAWCREIITRHAARFSEHQAILAAVKKRYRVVRFVMDQTGMGEGPVQTAEDAFGASLVEGVILSAPRQLAVVTATVKMFEDKRVRLPMGNVALRSDLHSIQKITGPTGGYRVLTPRTGKGENQTEAAGHSDRAWAAFLALAGASDPSPPPIGVQKPKESTIGGNIHKRRTSVLDRPLAFTRRASGLYMPRKRS